MVEVELAAGHLQLRLDRSERDGAERFEIIIDRADPKVLVYPELLLTMAGKGHKGSLWPALSDAWKLELPWPIEFYDDWIRFTPSDDRVWVPIGHDGDGTMYGDAFIGGTLHIYAANRTAAYKVVAYHQEHRAYVLEWPD